MPFSSLLHFGRIAAFTFALAITSGIRAVPPAADTITAVESYTDKARYAPGERVAIHVVVRNRGTTTTPELRAEVTLWRLGQKVAAISTEPFRVAGGREADETVEWTAPGSDYTGYFVAADVVGPAGVLDRTQTAIDVSSDWGRFPRYGYIAHYSQQEGADPGTWIAELNRFHIDGLEYYDYQSRHERPLAGTPDRPAASWRDIAGRRIDGRILGEFLREARARNMVSMAYNASYSAYDNAFTNGSGVKLRWATWDKPSGPRTIDSAKALPITGGGYAWQTTKLYYMNQNSPEWQDYLFKQMAELFRAYPFDGWHVDTFGADGAYAYDGTYVDFVAGFPNFVNRAKAYLHKRIVFQTVNAVGQQLTAKAAVDFVYSELWDGHETFASLLTTADDVHATNARVGLVFPAYLHRGNKTAAVGRPFNPPSVLLTDAVIFASGASHIELGDGWRMLSSEYFPDDARFTVTPALRAALRHYYDFATAYENYLRFEVAPASLVATLPAFPTDAHGAPNRVWTLARKANDTTVLHLINLLGSDRADWRDVPADRPDAPLLTDVVVRIYGSAKVTTVGWASPDVDGGRYHPLECTRGTSGGREYLEIRLPSLKYWDAVFLK